MTERTTYDIFLSHDRGGNDSYVRRLTDELSREFPDARVVSSTDPSFSGEGWRERLDATLGRCTALVAVIGADWLARVGGTDQNPEHRDNRFRAELEAGIRRGVPLISAMVGGTALPADHELPPSLRALRVGDGARLSELTWERDVDRLAEAIKRTQLTLPLQVGTVFAGHRIESLLGRGAMGVVYRAHHLSWARSDAIKVVSPELARQWGIRERFTHESQLAASLNHDNVVTVYDAGEEDGLLYLTMQLVQGPALSTLLALEGSLSAAQTVEILAPVTDALANAHERGLVHRDVTPGNIMIDETGEKPRPYLGDFGIAREKGEGSVLTLQGASIVGTMDYMSPEYIRGEVIDGKADVYALGCILFEMLTGEPPYGSRRGMRALWAHLQERPAPLAEFRSDVTSSWDELILAAMAHDPAQRLSAAEFAETLRTLLPAVIPRSQRPAGTTTTGESTAHGPEISTSAALQGQELARRHRERTGIFICYRREDTSWPARALAEALRDRFGKESVFMDVDSVRVGNWRTQINDSLDASAVVVVLIGESWMEELTNRKGGDDDVRYEISTAIRRDMQILPVTFGNVALPKKSELPEEIAALVDHEAYQLGEGRYWRPMVAILMEDLAVALPLRVLSSTPDGDAQGPAAM